jgi:hypothetical protein
MSVKKALIFSTIQGHASIAEAIVEGLERNNWQTRTFSYTDPIFKLYIWVYRHAPWLGRYSYKMLFFPLTMRFVAWYTRRTHKVVFEQAIKEFPAPVIISSSYGFDTSIFKWKMSNQKTSPQTLYMNIVVDPRTFFAPEITSRADVNCAFDQKTVELAKAFKPNANVIETGWFVRERFRQKTTKQKEKTALGLDPKVLTILIVAGSEGEVKSAKLIHPMLAQKNPIQIILACGKNEELLQEFQTLSQQIPAESKNKLIALPFTKEINRYMCAADLIVGKAGPNMLFEAVATETPFFATTHFAGQEDGNLELIHEYGIGYVEEDLHKAQEKIEQIIAQPEELQKFHANLKKLASFNDQSIKKLLAFIETHQRET